MKQIETIHAAGHVICHDITIIIRDEIKDTAFRKGHIVTEEDIPKLLSIGKDHLYVWEKEEGMLHENEAADILAGICQNEHMSQTPVKEGKIELIAEAEGVFLVDTCRLDRINEIDELMIATRHSNFPVRKGDRLAGTRVIPLVIREEYLEEAKAVWDQRPLLRIAPYVRKTAGIVTTGSEVYYNRIVDKFTPVVTGKLEEFGVKVKEHMSVPDDKEQIIDAIRKLKSAGVDLILCTGGMSVDPDDLTPAAVKACGAEVVSYGAPVLPGAMFLLGYFQDDTPVLGLPGCVMYAKATIFDLILPRVLADVKITKQEIAHMGHGGLCLSCKPCTFPDCGFGKGV